MIYPFCRFLLGSHLVLSSMVALATAWSSWTWLPNLVHTVPISPVFVPGPTSFISHGTSTTRHLPHPNSIPLHTQQHTSFPQPLHSFSSPSGPWVQGMVMTAGSVGQSVGGTFIPTTHFTPHSVTTNFPGHSLHQNLNPIHFLDSQPRGSPINTGNFNKQHVPSIQHGSGLSSPSHLHLSSVQRGPLQQLPPQPQFIPLIPGQTGRPASGFRQQTASHPRPSSVPQLSNSRRRRPQHLPSSRGGRPSTISQRVSNVQGAPAISRLSSNLSKDVPIINQGVSHSSRVKPSGSLIGHHDHRHMNAAQLSAHLQMENTLAKLKLGKPTLDNGDEVDLSDCDSTPNYFAGGVEYLITNNETKCPLMKWKDAADFCQRIRMEIVSLDKSMNKKTVKEILGLTKLFNIRGFWTGGIVQHPTNKRPFHTVVWASVPNSSEMVVPGKGIFSPKGEPRMGGPQPDNWEFLTSSDKLEKRKELCIAVLDNMYFDGVKLHDLACYHKLPVVCWKATKRIVESSDRPNLIGGAMRP